MVDVNLGGWDRPLFGDVMLGGLFDRLRREMDWSAGGFGTPSLGLSEGLRGLELRDRDGELQVQLDAPGFVEDDIEVTIGRDTLTIRGERKGDVPEGYRPLRRERGALSFTRSFTLPCEVQQDQARASLRHGILTLILPKAQASQPRAIPVKSS